MLRMWMVIVAVASTWGVGAVDAAEPLTRLTFVLEQMKESRNRTNVLQYEVAKDTLFDTNALTANRPARLNFKSVHETKTVLQQGSSKVTKVISNRLYEDTSLNHVSDMRTVITDNYAAYWQGIPAMAVQYDHTSPSAMESDFERTVKGLSTSPDYWDYAAGFNLESLPPEELSLTENNISGNTVFTIEWRKGGVKRGSFVVDPSRGFLVTRGIWFGDGETPIS